MRAFALFVPLALVVTLVGGCVGNTTQAYTPRTREFDIYVHAQSSDTIDLYEKNDGNQSKAVGITFKLSPDDDQVVPGPEIRAKEGDTIIIRLHNLNGLSHSLHLHGGLIPWEMDGVDHLTQNPVATGEEFVYTFPNMKAGTYWYHCHVDASHHIDFGMYGAFIVEELEPTIAFDREYVILLDEWDNCHVHGNTEPVYTGPGSSNQEDTPDTQTQTQCYYRFLLDNMAQNRLVTSVGGTTGSTVPQPAKSQICPVLESSPDSAAKQQALLAAGCTSAHEHGTPPPQQEPRGWWPETHPVYNPEYNTFVVNGKAFPDTPVFPVKGGETVKFRLINAGNLVHTWHPHGHTMLITHKDGYELTAPYKADTLAIAPGERYDFIMEMDNPGLWMIHDQMGQYAANDNVHPGGMMACFPYDGFRGIDAFAMQRSLDCNTEGMKLLAAHGTHGG